MRYIMTIIWAVLISSVISYVLSNMAGDPFNLTHTLILAAILSVVVFILGDGILKNQEDH